MSDFINNEEVVVLPDSTSKSVVVMSFEIFGVPGFKTVRAGNASPSRRMRAVINQLDRDVKARMETLDALTADERAMYGKAEKLLKDIQDLTIRFLGVANAPEMFRPAEDLQVVSTEEFFNIADTVYVGNFDLFMKHLDTIDAGLQAYHEDRQRRMKDKNPRLIPITLKLYRLTGGLFGTTEFHFVLSYRDGGLTMIGYDEPEEAVRGIITAMLRDVKNFRLSDYLRASESFKPGYKSALRLTDAMIDSMPSVNITHVTDLSSGTATMLQERNRDGKGKEVALMLNKMELESRVRFQEFIGAMKIITDSNGTRTEYGFEVPDPSGIRMAAVLAGRIE